MMSKAVGVGLVLCAVAVAALPLSAGAQDGQHDFDFELGHWHIHLKQRMHSPDGLEYVGVDFDGTSTTRPIWKGQGEIEEFETKSPTGPSRALRCGRTMRRATSGGSTGEQQKRDPLRATDSGQFKDGVGEFYAQDSLNGKLIFAAIHLVEDQHRHASLRAVVLGRRRQDVGSELDHRPKSRARRPQHPRGADGRRASIRLPVRHGAVSPEAAPAPAIRFHHMGRKAMALPPDTRSGVGARFLTETHASGSSSGQLMGLTLRTYNPETHEWYLYWANSKDGVVSAPQFGRFKAGVGDFYACDTFNGRGILVRYEWTGTMSKSPRFEQAYSEPTAGSRGK